MWVGVLGHSYERRFQHKAHCEIVIHFNRREERFWCEGKIHDGGDEAERWVREGSPPDSEGWLINDPPHYLLHILPARTTTPYLDASINDHLPRLRPEFEWEFENNNLKTIWLFSSIFPVMMNSELWRCNSKILIMYMQRREAKSAVSLNIVQMDLDPTPPSMLTSFVEKINKIIC